MRHTHTSSCQGPAFPLLKSVGKGATHPRASHHVTPIHLLVSLPLSLCSSLWGKRQNTHARHITKGQHTHARPTNRSSGLFPTSPLLKPFEEGGNTPTRVTSAGLPVNLLLSPCPVYPAKNHRMRRSRVAFPIDIYMTDTRTSTKLGLCSDPRGVGWKVHLEKHLQHPQRISKQK